MKIMLYESLPTACSVLFSGRGGPVAPSELIQTGACAVSNCRRGRPDETVAAAGGGVAEVCVPCRCWFMVCCVCVCVGDI